MCTTFLISLFFFFFQAEDGIRDFCLSRGLGDVYKRQLGGWSGLCPTQELVDAYEMADGTTPILGYNADGSPIINSESGYSEEGFTEEADAEGYYPENTFNMFVDREPRFYATVTYSGAYWRGRQIDFRMGAPDGRTGGPCLLYTSDAADE